MKYIKSFAFLLTQIIKKSFLNYKMKASQGRCRFRFAFTRLSCVTCFFCARLHGNHKWDSHGHMNTNSCCPSSSTPPPSPPRGNYTLFVQTMGFGFCGWGLIIVLWASHPGCDPHLFSLWGKWTSDLCHLTLLLRAERGSLASKVPTEHSR